MFCIKCGKKFEKPGICRFCGEDNTVVSENTYSGSPEIYFLLRDEAEVLSEILNADNDKNDTIEKVNEIAYAAEPEISHNNVDVQIHEEPAQEAEPETEEPAAEEPVIGESGVIELDIEDPVIDDPIEFSEPVLPEKEEIPYYGDEEPEMYEQGISPYDKFQKYKRWTVIALVAVLIVILLILLITSCGGDSKDKKKKSGSGKGDSSAVTTEVAETTSVTATTTTTTVTTTTTAPPEADDGSVKAAVVKNNAVNATVAADIASLLEKEGYKCTDVDLSVDDISSYDMVILPMPESDLNDVQIGNLNKFLKMENKNLLYIPSMSGKETANINGFLAEWDIGADNEGDVFFNSTPGSYKNESLEGDGYRIMVSVADNGVVGGADYSYADICAPDTKEVYDLGQKDNINVTKVLAIPEDSVLIIKELTALAKENGNVYSRGAVLIAEDVNNDSSHVIVFGSAPMFSSAYTNNAEFANKDVILGILNTAVGKASDSFSEGAGN